VRGARARARARVCVCMCVCVSFLIVLFPSSYFFFSLSRTLFPSLSLSLFRLSFLTFTSFSSDSKSPN